MQKSENNKGSVIVLPTEPFGNGCVCGLLDDHFLHLHVVAADKADHVNARSGIDAHAMAAFNLFALQDAASHINDLHDGFAVVVDDPVAVAEEDEAVVSGIARSKP